jgi:hypothetical protein
MGRPIVVAVHRGVQPPFDHASPIVHDRPPSSERTETMHVNQAERTIVCKVCFFGAYSVAKGEILEQLYDHFRAWQGEFTDFERRTFPPRDVMAQALEADQLDAAVSSAEEAFGAPWDELVEGGTLVWLRTPAAAGGESDEFDILVDSFTVDGPSETDVLRRFTLQGADSTVFVADADNRTTTLQAWRDLQRSGWSGPILVLVLNGDDTAEIAELLDHDGPIIAPEDHEDVARVLLKASRLAVDRGQRPS